MVDSVYTRPKLTGSMRESSSYTNMGRGITDRVLLMGHADGLTLYSLYLINNVQEAINHLNADTDSPLLRALLEVYYSGARDIWIMPVAPMEEYVPDPSQRLINGVGRGTTSWADLDITGLYDEMNSLRDMRHVDHTPAPSENTWNNYNFYERYYRRLEIAYEILMHQDLPQLITPVEALFNGTGPTDFLDQLADHCGDALDYTGSIRMGFLGTRLDVLNNDFNTMVTNVVSDARLNTQAANRKFVSIVFGEASINMREFPTSYTAPVVTAAIGKLANLPISRSWIYQNLPVVISPVGSDLTTAQITALTEMKVNPVMRTTKGRRGEPFQTVILTDNTLGEVGTDFWSMGQTRLIMHIIERVRSISNKYIGTIEYGEYKRKVQNYMIGLLSEGHIRGYDLNIIKAATDINRLLVEISVQPYLSLRQITFVTEVGPGV